MTTPEDILNTVYELGYDRGWRQRGDHVPFFGYGSAEPADSTNLPNTEKWLAELYGNLDLSDIVYARLRHGGYAGDPSTTSALHYAPHDDDSNYYIRRDLHDRLNLGSVAMGRTIDHIERDPAAAIDRLMDRIRELEQENDALRATHPNGDLDPEDDEWELEADSRTEAEITLDDSKVFDRAVIEYDIDVNAKRGKAGTVNARVDIDSVKLVSDN